MNYREVKPKTASGVVKTTLSTCRGFAANDPRVHQGYSGCSYDVASERIDYNHFRYYDPSTGRYVQSDRIGLGDGTNTYGYVYQNPIVNYDSNGLFSVTVSGTGTGSVGLGGNGQAGVFVSSGGDSGPADAGVFVSGGVNSGVRADAGIGVNFLRGGRENIDGTSVGSTFDLGPVSVSSFINPDTGEWVGAGFGINTPLPGADVSYNKSKSYSIRDWIRDFLGDSKPGKGGRYRDPRFNPCP